MDAQDIAQIVLSVASLVPNPISFALKLASIIPYQEIAEWLSSVENEPDPEVKKRRLENIQNQKISDELKEQHKQITSDVRQTEISDFILNFEKQHGDESILKAFDSDFIHKVYPEILDYYNEVGEVARAEGLDPGKIRYNKIDNETEQQKKLRETLAKQLNEKTDPEEILRAINDLEGAGYTPEDFGQDKGKLEAMVAEKYSGSLPKPDDNDDKLNEDIVEDEGEEDIVKDTTTSDDRFDQFMEMMMRFMKGQNTSPRKSINEIQAGDLEYYEIVFDSFTCSDTFAPTYTSSDWPAFKLDNSIGDIVKFNVLEVSIPYTWYNINSSNNKIDFIADNGGAPPLSTSGLITITPGVYTPTTLATVLQTAINAIVDINTNGGPYTVLIVNSVLEIKATSSFNIFQLSWNPNQNPEVAASIFGFNTFFRYANGTIANPNPILGNFEPLKPPGNYFINSQNIGNQINLLLPLNDVSNTSSNMLGPQVAAVPFSNVVVGELTTWQASATEKWFDLQMRVNGVWDFFVSSNLNPNVPIQLNGSGFTVRLGILIKPKQNISSDGYKYIVDSTREGYFKDDSSGYRDPWDFANDTLEREYVSNSLKRRR